MKPLIWKTHKRREEFNECPHCGGSLRWVYDGDVWIPCDKEPTLFMLHPEGRSVVVYKHQVYEHCLIYRKNDRRFTGAALQGNIPHYYTCPVLKERRKAFAKGVSIS
jgi:hypothetical protein